MQGSLLWILVDRLMGAHHGRYALASDLHE